MPCCGKNKSDEEETAEEEVASKKGKYQGTAEDDENLSFVWQPTLKNAKKIAYVRQLERRYERLQYAYFNLSAELARLQFCLREIVQADSCDRIKLIDDVKRKIFQKVNCNVYPTLEQDNIEMGNLQRKQHLLVASLRQQIGSFQKASAVLKEREERGEFLAEERERGSQNSLTNKTHLTSTQSLISTAKEINETTSIHTINYADQFLIDTTSSGPKDKSKKAKKWDKLKAKTPKTTEASTSKSAKKENSDKFANNSAKTSQAKIKKISSQSNLAPTPELLSKRAEISTETLSSGQSIISTRSASFKELREKYQKNQSPGK